MKLGAQADRDTVKNEQMDHFDLADVELPKELLDLGADFADDVLANLSGFMDSAKPGKVDIMKELNDIAMSCFNDTDESYGYYQNKAENLYPASISETSAPMEPINQVSGYATWQSASAPKENYKDLFDAMERVRSVCDVFSDWDQAGGVEVVERPVLEPIHNLLPSTKAMYAAASSPVIVNREKPIFVPNPVPNPYSPQYNNENYEEEEEPIAPIRKITNRMPSPYDIKAPRSSGSYSQRKNKSIDETEPKKRRFKKEAKMKVKKNGDRALVAYEYMAGLALLNGANYVSQVYDFVTVNMPKTRTKGPAQTWKNSLREQLSKNFSGFFSKRMVSEAGTKKLNCYSMIEDQKKEFYARYPVSYANPSDYLFNPADFEAIYTGAKGLPTQEEVQDARRRDEQMAAPRPEENAEGPQIERYVLANQAPQQFLGQPDDGFDPDFF